LKNISIFVYENAEKSPQVKLEIHHGRQNRYVFPKSKMPLDMP